MTTTTATAINLIAIYFWTITRIAGFLFTLWLWRTERRKFYLMFCVAWATGAGSGIVRLVAALNANSSVIVVNSLVFLPVSGITGLLGLYSLSKHVRNRIMTISTKANGDVVGIVPFVDEDPITPRFNKNENGAR